MKRGKRTAPQDEQGDMLAVERFNPAQLAAMPKDPDSLIAFAILNGQADAIEKLTRLRVELQDKEDFKELSRARAAALKEFPPITKNRRSVVTSTKGDYKFEWADLSGITSTVDPVLEKYGLSYTWDAEMANGAAQLQIRCTLWHENGASMSSTFPVPTSSGAGMSDQQRFASAQMFGRRKSLEQVLGLVIEDMPFDVAQQFDLTPLNDQQAHNLRALLEEVGGDKAAFLAIYGVKEFAELPSVNYPGALQTLENRRRKGGQKL